MEKQKFVEVSKIYDFVSDISNLNILMTNIKYHKNPSPTSKVIVLRKFEEYFNTEAKFQQNYGGKRKNIQGYKVKILISDPKITFRENRKKLREYAENVIELIVDQKPKEKLKYTISLEKTRGKSYYLSIFFIDRFVYEKPKIKTVLKKEYINKNTLKVSRKSAKNAILHEYKEEIKVLFSNKLRFNLIHSSAKRNNFIEIMDILKKNIDKIEKHFFELKNYFYLLKKETLKKSIKKGNKTIYINNVDGFWGDLSQEYRKRYIRAYNSFINTFNLQISRKDNLDIEKVKRDLKSTKESFFRNVLKYEQALLAMEKAIFTGDFAKKYRKI